MSTPPTNPAAGCVFALLGVAAVVLLCISIYALAWTVVILG